jgi:hypothetical protein
VSPDLRDRGAAIIRLQAKLVTEHGLSQLARLVGLDVDELLESRDFPAAIRPQGTTGLYIDRSALLEWWQTR